MTDEYEYTFRFMNILNAGFYILQAYRVNWFLTQNFRDHGVPNELDLWIFESSLL